jgi:integrase
LPLDDGDIKACKRSLNKLDDKDQLLLRLLATTGMRLSEAFEISGEKTERGIRYVIVGNKTEQSLRRVPLPAHALPYLPRNRQRESDQGRMSVRQNSAGVDRRPRR